MKQWIPGMSLEDYAAMWVDMEPHIRTLQKKAALAEKIVEFGTRGGVSTWALLESLVMTGTMISIDIDPNIPSMVPQPVLEDHRWSFLCADTTRLPLRTWADLVFIDTSHTYHDTQVELRAAAAMLPQTILLHDYLDPNYPGVQQAVDEFVGGPWKLKVEESPWGLAILTRT
jgi:methyltransferase family protein